MKRPLRANVGMVVLGLATPLAACSSMPENFLASAPSAMAVG